MPYLPTPSEDIDHKQRLFEDAYHTVFKDNEQPPSTSEGEIAGLDSKTVHKRINGFTENMKIILGALDELQDIHPFLGVAIVAFKLVVSLDLTRRENNKKVIAVQLQMQDMMCVLFQLRNIRDSTVEGPGGLTIEDRMQEQLVNIAGDIKECGSACDVYLKKGLLAKTLKSKNYEQRLAEYAERFVEHRNNLQFAITVHMTMGMESVNEKLDRQDEQLRSIGDQLRELFRKLDSSRERDLLKFIDDNGGARACIEDSVLLEKLLKKSGETAAGISLSAGRHGDELPIARKVLLKELSEDLEVTFRRNMTLFEGKLDIQLNLINALRTQMSNQESHIITAIKAGSYERILDPDLQYIWKEMGWKGSVKARHFVLALRDHFTDKFGKRDGGTESGSEYDDQWALFYVNIAYLQPILEAFDDDGTGFINIKEVNMFCHSRPQDWTLLQWLAYWAAGWHLNVSGYREKIYATVQKMLSLSFVVYEDNKQIVSDYLDSWIFCRLDLLLRFTKPISESVYIHPELAKLSREFAASEEKLFGNNLKSLMFQVDSPATVSLVTGPGRIERYIYPLLHLVLQRHLDVIKYSCHHILNKEEFKSAIASLDSLFVTLDDRTADLEAIYKQMHLNVNSHFQNFAFGMFLASYGDPEQVYRPRDNKLWSQNIDDYEDEDEEVDGRPNIDHISSDILNRGVEDDFNFKTSDIDKPDFAEDQSETLSGLWSGYCFITIDSTETYYTEGGLLTFNINEMSQLRDKQTFSGMGEHHLGFFSVFYGSVTENTKDPSEPTIEFSFEYADGSILVLEGFFDAEEQAISGNWYKQIVEESDDEDDIENQSDEEEDRDTVTGLFTFTRTPPDIFRYKYTSEEFKANRARARWNFALKAIQHRVQRETPTSWEFIKMRRSEGKKLLGLTVQYEIWFNDYATAKELTKEEMDELSRLQREMDPTDARLYHSLAIYTMQRLPIHTARSCDTCEKDIIYYQYSCITCVEDDYANCINLCGNCINTEPTYGSLSHSISHTILRSQYILQDAMAACLIPDAQNMSARIKSSFMKASSARKKPLCACCEKPITLPCWVCVECAPSLYICESCYQNKASVSQERDDHAPSDALMRIYDVVEVEKRDDNQFNRLERRLEVVEKNFASLDAKLSERLSNLENMLHQFLKGPTDNGVDILNVAQQVLHPEYKASSVSQNDERTSTIVDKDKVDEEISNSEDENDLNSTQEEVEEAEDEPENCGSAEDY